MKTVKKLFLSILLILSVCCVQPMLAQTIDGVEYQLDNYEKTAKVNGVDYAATMVVIPQTLNYEGTDYSVVGFEDDNCFNYHEELQSVVIQIPMDEIPARFFSYCRNLSSITLPDGIKSVGDNAFEYCENLQSLDFLPQSVNSYGDYAFEGCCNLSEVVISKDKKYGQGVFNGCSGVTSMTIEAIPQDSYAYFDFWGMDNLKKIRIEDSKEPLVTSLPQYSPVEEVYIGRDILPVSDFNEFNNFPKQSLKSVVFGDYVTSVPAKIFNGANQLTSVAWGNGIKYIGKGAFANTCLSSINIPASVDSLYSNTFAGISTLTSVSLHSGLKYIGEGCFSGSAITDVELPENINVIEKDVFSGCMQLQSIVIPDNVVSIGASAFFNCKKLSQINIGKNVKEIGDAAFYECNKLYDVYYNGTISDWCKIEMHADTYPEDTNPLLSAKNFYINNGISYKKVTDLVIPEDVNKIKEYSFAGCKAFTSVTIPDNVVSIGESAFEYCISIKKIDVNADTINRTAFLGCKADTLIFGSNVKVVKDHAFYTLLNYPSNLIYEGDMRHWLKMEVEVNAFKCGKLKIDGELLVNLELDKYMTTSIRPYAFNYCTSLKTVNLPYSVKNIGPLAFAYCANLTNVTAKGIKQIGDMAFYECGNLLKVNLLQDNQTRAAETTEELINIGVGAFSNCKKLEEIILPENLGNIGSSAFAGTPWYENKFNDGVVYFGTTLYEYKGQMPENTDIVVKEGTVRIGDNAFDNQPNLKSIKIPNTVESIGESAFQASGIKSLVLPESVTEIGANAFSYSELESIIMPESIDTIRVDVFKNSYSLKSINIPASVDFIAHDAFAGCEALENIVIEDSEKPLVLEGYYLYLYNNEYYPVLPDAFAFSESSPKHLYIGRELQGNAIGDYYYPLKYAYKVDSLQTLTLGKYVKEIELSSMPVYYEWRDGKDFYFTPLTSITCQGDIPPVCIYDEYSDDLFPEFIKIAVPLRVPKDAVEAYKSADVWKDFYVIDGIDFTGVSEIKSESNKEPIYNIKGERVKDNYKNLPAGVYIQGGKKFIIM